MDETLGGEGRRGVGGVRSGRPFGQWYDVQQHADSSTPRGRRARHVPRVAEHPGSGDIEPVPNRTKGRTMAGNDLGGLLGSLLGGGGQSGGGAGGILGSLIGALAGARGTGGGNGSNPLGGLLEMLTRSGLTDQTQSWVGTGENQSVSGTQIAEALPDETLRKVAQDAGVSPQEAADQIARTLPTAVDRLTPTGSMPEGSLEDIIRRQQL
ncbi:YidB family protein [Streptomyces zaomyceticus]|uniref:YidB family protein n=1 Tax=Streptomyces zaomyceticus TaxID=68286 RepID=UPI0036985A5E